VVGQKRSGCSQPHIARIELLFGQTPRSFRMLNTSNPALISHTEFKR